MRNLIYRIVYEDSDYIIRDPRDIDWRTYDWTAGYVDHIVTEDEIYRPYLISELYYETTQYEDIILLLNNIGDPFAMRPGIKIRIPNKGALDEFILQNKI